MENGGKGEISTVLKNITLEKRVSGKNIIFWGNIQPCPRGEDFVKLYEPVPGLEGEVALVASVDLLLVHSATVFIQ